MKMLFRITLTVMFSTALYRSFAQNLNAVKLTASDASAQDWFGSGVAISGTTMVVGAPRDDDNGIDSGSAYVFEREGTAWTEKTKLTASDGAAGDQFGFSVAIAGDYIAIGAYHDDVGNNASQGSAYVYIRAGNTWQEQAKLVAPDGAAADGFGQSLDLDAGHVIIGAPSDDDQGENSGSAYIYAHENGSWQFQTKLIPPFEKPGCIFGVSVAIAGEYALVGASSGGDFQNSAGAAYMFRNDVAGGTGWTADNNFNDNEPVAGNFFGASVTLSGDYALVGNPGIFLDRPGSVYALELIAGVLWAVQAVFTSSDEHRQDGFGSRVALEDSYAVIAREDTAYLFQREASTWRERNLLTANDGARDNNFGAAVAIDSNTIVVGAYTDGDKGIDAGAVYVYDDFIAVSVAERDADVPGRFHLRQNYPNPFNPSTIIQYELPHASQVTLAIYNLLGEKVRTLVDAKESGGIKQVTWDGRDGREQRVSSGVYLYRLEAGEFTMTRRLVLMR